ncbi:MAG: tyrosine-protein phosphatase, partial [Syntrophomonadaceae bacterium]|nr:tyrosine-protein phosphatase [Syntrophomonadaceae bacterium]
ANQQKTGVLFHCAAGKDRTGVVAALLLNLLGAKDGDILANYEVTFSYLFSDTPFETSNLPLNLANSNRENMVAFLENLKTDYGNVYNYLIECGLTEAQLETIKALFTS